MVGTFFNIAPSFGINAGDVCLYEFGVGMFTVDMGR
jgi:hypothetical protein